MLFIIYELISVNDLNKFYSLFQVQDKLEDHISCAQPVGTGNVDLAVEVRAKCEKSTSRDAQELARILRDPHVKVSFRTFSGECLVSR